MYYVSRGKTLEQLTKEPAPTEIGSLWRFVRRRSMCQQLSEVAWATEPWYEFPPPPSALTLNSLDTFEGSVESIWPSAAAERQYRARLRLQGLAQEGAHH